VSGKLQDWTSLGQLAFLVCSVAISCQNHSPAFVLCRETKVGDAHAKVTERARTLGLTFTDSPGHDASDGVHKIKAYIRTGHGLLRGIEGCEVWYRNEVVDKVEYFAD